MPTPGHGLWSSILRYLCSHKKFLFRSFWWRHCMWFAVWPPPPNQKSWLRLWQHANWLHNYQRWSSRGHILQSFFLKVKSLALASKPQVLSNCPVLGSKTALNFEPLKLCIIIIIRGGVLEDVLGLENTFWSPWPRSLKSSKIAIFGNVKIL